MRKRCKRKVWALVDPIKHAIEGACITPRETLNELLSDEWKSYYEFTDGRANLDSWNGLVRVNNLAEALAGFKVGRDEVMPHCKKLEDELIAAAYRFQKIGRMGLTGVGLQAAKDVIEYHDLQRSSIARSQYEKAIALTEARIKSGNVKVVDLWKSLGAPVEAV